MSTYNLIGESLMNNSINYGNFTELLMKNISELHETKTSDDGKVIMECNTDASNNKSKPTHNDCKQ